MRQKRQKYSSIIGAAEAWGKTAIPLTLKSNREYSSLIIKTKRGYKLTKPCRGAHGNVILNALFGSLLNLFAEVHLIHTHTLCNCHIPDKFSGNPKHPIKDPGDFTVVKILKYESIILVSPDGRIFELKSSDNIHDIEELRSIMPLASIDINAKANISYNILEEKMKKGDRFIVIHKEGNSLTSSHRVIFVDNRTGVNYLFVQSGYAGGLTPLLNSDGTPVITDFSKDK